MHTEVTYSTQVFLPLIISGILLLSSSVSLFFYAHQKQPVYLSSCVFQIAAFLFAISEAAVNYCSDTMQLSIGIQFYRLLHVVGATFIFLIPWLIYTYGSNVWTSVQKTVVFVSALVVIALAASAFIVPDTFVSITQYAPESNFKETSQTSGHKGPLYTMRDIFIGFSFIYGVIILLKIRKNSKVLEAPARWTFYGLVWAICFSSNDLVNAYTHHNLFLPPVLDFSYTVIGLSFFSIATTQGIFKLFYSQLLSSEQKYRRTTDLVYSIVDSIDAVIIATDADYRVTLWNQTAEQKTQMTPSQVIGKPIESVMPKLKDDFTKLQRAAADGKTTIEEKQLQLPNGAVQHEELKILPIVSESINGAVLIISDISEKKRINEVMVQTEKMHSIGGLAAGMAHEINNPLSGMMQNAQVLQNRINVTLPANIRVAQEANISMDAMDAYFKARRFPEMLQAVIESGNRAASIIINMLEFAKNPSITPTTIDIHTLLEEVLLLAHSDWDIKQIYDFKKIHIERNYDKDLPKVPCIPQSIKQVFFNILKNAAHAMSHSPQGTAPTISLRTMSHEQFARIEIENNGPSIPKDILQRIFEPFFTTKKIGEGTGLGLSVSYFIISQNHNGQLQVLSLPQKGTTFIIDLPLVQAQTTLTQMPSKISTAPSGQ